MADLHLAARAALARCAAPSRIGALGSEAGVVLQPITDRSLTLLIAHRGGRAEAQRIAMRLGMTLPSGPKMTTANGLAALWAGPEHWLLMAEPHGSTAAATLVDALAPLCIMVDQSDARAVLGVSGTRAREALAKGFPIDLHPRAFGPGDVALTVAAGVSATIWQTDATPKFEIAIPRSFAESFWHWLTEAAAEYGCAVVE